MNKSIGIYLTGVGILSLGYLFIKSLSSKSAPLSLQRTRKVLRQIKYQMLIVCVNFTNKLDKNMLSIPLEILPKLGEQLRTNMAAFYQQKEEIIIGKYNISHDELAGSLNYYKDDPEINKNQEEILEMMERGCNGLMPDFTVAQEAQQLHSCEQIKQIYRNMCEMIAISVWRKLCEIKRNDPFFDSNNDEHFKRAIRQISIFDMKTRFTNQKGYKQEWGCPSQVFFKVMESKKKENNEFRDKIAAIDKSYEKIIQKVSYSPQSINPDAIKEIFEESNNIISQIIIEAAENEENSS